ncbi:hypothetical protein VTJ04DRAFT_4463 [Mycothermus thermophilus]|uniref:uncharacterized protein n=1 Tax=Humicola insolens TaxID=85995 RepID=UPI003742C64F
MNETIDGEMGGKWTDGKRSGGGGVPVRQCTFLPLYQPTYDLYNIHPPLHTLAQQPTNTTKDDGIGSRYSRHSYLGTTASLRLWDSYRRR